MDNSKIFKQAWAMARAGQKNYGGKVSEYFALSLKAVYATLKNVATGLIKEVYVLKKDNAKGTSWHTQLRQRKLNKAFAARQNNFVVIALSQAGYIVVDGRRYYPNYKNAVDAGVYAIVNIDELERTKSYNFDPKYKTADLPVFADFADLRVQATKQYSVNNALPQITVTRVWDQTADLDGFDVTTNI